MAATIARFFGVARYLIRMIKLLSFSLLAAGLALVACSDNKSSGSSATCTNYAAALQSATEKCGGKARALPAEQIAAEASRLATICTNALNAPGNGISTSAVDACAARIVDTCADDGVCDDLANARGSLPDGAPCGTDAQCSGGDCRQASGSDTTCGTCGQRAAIGAACSDSREGPKCVREASCSTTNAATNGTCVARPSDLKEGDVCYDPSKPSTFGNCGTGLRCKVTGTLGSPIKCTPRAASGEACVNTSDCTSELACVNEKCAPRLADGAECKSPSECASGACPAATRKCAAPVYGAAGAACNSNDLLCLRGDCSSTGSSEAGTCVDPIPDGAACTKSGTSSSKGPYCDRYATCEKGICQIFDPSTCR